ncbi:LPS export ABC transporter periplasmic protein LptC [Roseivirga sp. BDSF3-8]|uniref:LPS export ABC transporter periplasmic protein LptC n=1 Tax=Roseivirga sp. BDSF3-8 TaxID=3241598 RepID=UPI00353236EE
MFTSRRHTFLSLMLMAIVAVATACSDDSKALEEMKPYEGPMLEMDSVETLFSDSAIVRVRLVAGKRLDFRNGDSEYPEGVYIEFFGPDGNLRSTLRSNKGFYHGETNLYQVDGNVEVINEQSEKLNTEQLFWNPADEQVYTEKFVRIQSDGQLLMGEGLRAEQDFSSYEIMKPTANIDMEQQ